MVSARFIFYSHFAIQKKYLLCGLFVYYELIHDAICEDICEDEDLYAFTPCGFHIPGHLCIVCDISGRKALRA